MSDLLTISRTSQQLIFDEFSKNQNVVKWRLRRYLARLHIHVLKALYAVVLASDYVMAHLESKELSVATATNPLLQSRVLRQHSCLREHRCTNRSRYTTNLPDPSNNNNPVREGSPLSTRSRSTRDQPPCFVFFFCLNDIPKD